MGVRMGTFGGKVGVNEGIGREYIGNIFPKSG